MRKPIDLASDGENRTEHSGELSVAGPSGVDLSNACGHVTATMLRRVHRPKTEYEDCVKIGGQWVHLRVCLSCGKVGCCDDSPNRHATAHHHETGHPIITSGEADETWTYCYVDERLLSAE